MTQLAMGRRLVLAQPDQSLGLTADRPLQIATTQTEAREVIRAQTHDFDHGGISVRLRYRLSRHAVRTELSV